MAKTQYTLRPIFKILSLILFFQPLAWASEVEPFADLTCRQILSSFPHIERYIHPSNVFRNEGGIQISEANLGEVIDRLSKHPVSGRYFAPFFEMKIGGKEGLKRLVDLGNPKFHVLIALLRSYRAYAFNSESHFALRITQAPGFFGRVNFHQPSWENFWNIFRSSVDLIGRYENDGKIIDGVPASYHIHDPIIIFDPKVLDPRKTGYPVRPLDLEKEIQRKLGSFTSLWTPFNMMSFGDEIARWHHQGAAPTMAFREAFDGSQKIEYEKLISFFEEILQRPFSGNEDLINSRAIKFAEVAQANADYYFISSADIFNYFVHNPHHETAQFDLRTQKSAFSLESGIYPSLKTVLFDKETGKFYEFEVVNSH